MKKNFVEFLSPGTFVSECTTKEIDSWDVAKAQDMARDIVERHAAKPYGFRFITRTREADELDSTITDTSGIYYLGGRLRTLAEVEADNLPNEETLRWNMKANDYPVVIENNNSWKFTAPFTDRDTLLDWTQ
jgi:hypothetical protein